MYLSLCGFDSVYIDCSFHVALRCCCAGMDSMLAASLLHNFSFFIITLFLTCDQGRGTFNLLCTLASLFGFIGSEIQSNQSHILSSIFQTNSRQNKKSLQNEHFFKWQIMHTQDEEKQHGSLNRAKSQQVLAYMILKNPISFDPIWSDPAVYNPTVPLAVLLILYSQGSASSTPALQACKIDDIPMRTVWY